MHPVVNSTITEAFPNLVLRDPHPVHIFTSSQHPSRQSTFLLPQTFGWKWFSFINACILHTFINGLFTSLHHEGFCPGVPDDGQFPACPPRLTTHLPSSPACCSLHHPATLLLEAASSFACPDINFHNSTGLSVFTPGLYTVRLYKSWITCLGFLCQPQELWVWFLQRFFLLQFFLDTVTSGILCAGGIGQRQYSVEKMCYTKKKRLID